MSLILNPAPRQQEQSTAATGTQNDFALTGNLTYLRCTNTAALIFTGFTVNGAAPQPGDRVILDNLGTSSVRCTHENGASTAANRTVSPSTFGQIIGAGGRLLVIYDGVDDRWRVVLIAPGAPIDLTFNAAHYTGSSAMTWGVAAGDVVAARYAQYGKEIFLEHVVVFGTIGGTPHEQLKFNIEAAAGFTLGPPRYQQCVVYDNGTRKAGFIFSSAGNGLLFELMTLANWLASTDLQRSYFAGWVPIL